MLLRSGRNIELPHVYENTSHGDVDTHALKLQQELDILVKERDQRKQERALMGIQEVLPEHKWHNNMDKFMKDVKKGKQNLFQKAYVNQQPVKTITPTPSVGEVVITKVKNIAEMGIYVTLPEYNNIEAFIPTSELYHLLTPVGHTKCAIVMRVRDKYIDLSERRVSKADASKCMEKYQNTI